MNVSKEELLHIANLADLNINENEINEYLKNLDDILEYVKILEKAPVDKLEEHDNVNDLKNAFRKDETKKFDNVEGIMKNAPDTENNMFKIPKVIQ